MIFISEVDKQRWQLLQLTLMKTCTLTTEKFFNNLIFVIIFITLKCFAQFLLPCLFTIRILITISVPFDGNFIEVLVTRWWFFAANSESICKSKLEPVAKARTGMQQTIVKNFSFVCNRTFHKFIKLNLNGELDPTQLRHEFIFAK